MQLRTSHAGRLFLSSQGSNRRFLGPIRVQTPYLLDLEESSLSGAFEILFRAEAQRGNQKLDFPPLSGENHAYLMLPSAESRVKVLRRLVTSTPSGALVRRGPLELGKTPLFIFAPEGQTFSLQLSILGHQSLTYQLELTPSTEGQQHDLVLSPLGG